MLGEHAGLDQMAAARMRNVVLRAVHVLAEQQVGRGLRPEPREATDVDGAH